MCNQYDREIESHKTMNDLKVSYRNIAAYNFKITL